MLTEWLRAVSSWKVDVPVAVADTLRGFIFGVVVVVLLVVLKVARQRRTQALADPNAPAYSGLVFVAGLLLVALLEQVERFGEPDIGVRTIATAASMIAALFAVRYIVVLTWLESREHRAERKAARQRVDPR